MKKVFCFLCVLLLGLGFSSVAKAIEPWGDENEYFFDYYTGLLWYDPIVFQGMSQSELKTWYDGQTECRFATYDEIMDLYDRDLSMDVHRNYAYWDIMGAPTDQHFDYTYTYQIFRWVGYYDYDTLDNELSDAKVFVLEGDMILDQAPLFGIVRAWYDVFTYPSVGAWVICDYGPDSSKQAMMIINGTIRKIYTLTHVGLGNSTQNRIKAFITKLEAIGEFIEVGKLEEACKQLKSIRAKVDGDQSPPDWFKGESASDILSKIDGLMTAISCVE